MHADTQSSPAPRVTSDTSLLPFWRRIHQAMCLRLSRHGLPLSLSVAVLSLHTRDDIAEPAQLADLLMLPRQTMTFVLDALERKRLARRRPHPADRRRKIIQLTPSGHRQAQAILDDLIAYETDAARLTFAPDDVGAFRLTVARLADVLEQLNSATPHA